MDAKIFLLASWLLLGLTASAFTQQTGSKASAQLVTTNLSYEALWKSVEQKEKASLPESAAQIIETVYQKALKEKNSPQLLKSIIYQIKYQLITDRDLFPEKLKELEQYASDNTEPVEQSMLYSLLAQLYLQYYQSDYTINRRTAITGYVPEDIREWTGNIFVERITDYTRLSLKNTTILQQTDIIRYKDILNEGKSSRNFRPTVYDFLVNEGISTFTNLSRQAETFFRQTQFSDTSFFTENLQKFINMQIKADDYDLPLQAILLYQQLISFRLKYNQPDALLMADLDRIEFVYNHSAFDQRGAAYNHALSSLEAKNTGNPLCVEILHKQASYLLYENRGSSYDDNAKEAQTENLKTAYAICKKGIGQYPRYERIGILENLMTTLTDPHANIQTNGVVYPGKDLELKISHKNINRLTIEIYRINAPASAYSDTWKPAGLYTTKGTLVTRNQYTLDNPVPYMENDTVIRIPVKETGYYEYVIYAENNKKNLQNELFTVSRLMTLARSYDNKQEFLVTDRISGEPVSNAVVHIYKREKGKYIFGQSHPVPAGGILQIPAEKNGLYYRTTSGKDSASWYSSLSGSGNSFNSGNTETETVSLFTDRSIYRPGQTVFFKAIATRSSAKNPEVISKKAYTVTFTDANGKTIGSKELTSNDFGSFNGEFIIPQGLLSGNFSLNIPQTNAYCPVQVEEYKRPTFDIRFDTIADTYNFGDMIRISGNVKTFSGIDLQQAEVKYRVLIRPNWFWRWSSLESQDKQVAEGIVQTNDEGSFSFLFPAEKQFSDLKKENIFYLYQVEVSVTNTNGETQTSGTSVYVGDKSMILSINFPKDDAEWQISMNPWSNLPVNVNKDSLSAIRVTAINLSEKPVNATGTYEIFSLTGNQVLSDGIMDGKDWKQDKLITKGTFTTQQPFSLDALSKSASGRYRIILKSFDNQGREVSHEQSFVLYSNNDKNPPVMRYVWMSRPKTICKVGENTEIYFGSSAKNVSVLYDIFKKNQKLESQRFSLDNSIKKISIPFLDSYEDGIEVILTFVKDEQCFTRKVTVNRKKKERSLVFRTEVFRDKLLPGQAETWKVSVKDSNKQPVQAEILAAMYDASLDKLRPHEWSFSPIRLYAARGVSDFYPGSDIRSQYAYISIPGKYKDIPDFRYDSYNWFGLNFYQQTLRGYSTMGGVKRLSMAAPEMKEKAFAANAILADKVDGLAVAESLDQSTAMGATNPSASETQIPVRSNFNETAFFYPQLRTNETGETIISFTTPESNTTWKFMALAHTRDIRFAQLIQEVISQKQLMITPNLPRFIRQGDLTSVSCNISNLSGHVQSGEINIEFFDPQTEKTVLYADNQSQKFDLQAGRTSSVTWTFKVPGNIDLTACKIIARSADFSDGEQHLIPVLPNRMLVTETLPLNIPGKGSKEFIFNRLAEKQSATAENYRLTLEFASNPSWYAVQALPAMATPSNENVISWFAAYYANSMATSIANNTPGIRQVIDTWTQQGGSKETLLSNLEKNQELKNILLEESPWVLEAENETEQKQRLSLLFDINRSNDLSATAVLKLREMQHEDGGWGWFKGMYTNTSITQWILYGLGRMEASGALSQPDDVREMQQQAIAFIDRKFSDAFKQLKKYDKNWQKKQTFSNDELEYLYVRSFYKDIPGEKNAEAISFYNRLIENYWVKNTNLYQRALSATLLYRNGKKDIAAKIILSLKEHAVKKTDTGMYWANNNASAFFFQSATSIHTFMMQAFQETGASTEEMDQMKLWLLRQKQTQEWESTPATVDAVAALLQTGENWLASKGEVEIKLGNRIIESQQKEAGTGYFKQVYPATGITADMGFVSITKQDAGPAWGALYLQYFEDLDRITQSKTGLNVEKKLFIEKISGTGKVLTPAEEGNSLKTGDKVVVRLTIRNDRDMEYVMLKDMRAACFEPVEQISGIRRKESLLYYQTSKDASTSFFFDHLPKGTYVIEYPLYVTRSGEYSNGISSIQCLYAPEFSSHTQGERISID